jgi:putative ABC transport system permease protein
LLLGVTSTDAVTFSSVAILLCAAALFACFIPTRRAMRVDPMIALRYE